MLPADPWRFAWPEPGALIASSTPLLVALSLLVATFASYTSLAVVERMVVAPSVRVRRVWLVLGATAMGSGIWAMHFIAMIAYRLPIQTSYEAGWTVVSLVPGILGSALALHVMAADQVRLGRLLGAALFVALGIGAMHYTGMEAVRVDALMRYDPILFVLSIVVAFGLAAVALFTRFAFRSVGDERSRRVAAAVLMGFAVSGMHYTATAAVHFTPTGERHVPPGGGVGGLAILVLVLVSIIIGLALIGTVVDQRLTALADQAGDSEARHRTMLAAMPEGVLTVSASGLIQRSNPAAERMLGYPAGTLEGRLLTDLFDLVTGEGAGRDVAAVIRALALRPAETNARRADGTTFPAELRLYQLNLAHETVSDVLVTDMSASRSAEAERRQLELQLQQAQKLEAIGQLAAGAAHEINTPTQYVGDNIRFLQTAFADLSGVVSSLRELHVAVKTEHPLPLSAKVDQAIERADTDYLVAEIPKAIAQSLEGVTRVARIVRALKEFSHPGAGKAPVDLNHVIENTVTVATNEWKYVASVETDLDPSLPAITCAVGEISQVVLNLIVNAAHAIEAAHGPNGRKGTIRIRTTREDGFAVIRVSDDGTGIPESARARVFEPFFTTKEVGRGTGQGLALAHSVVTRRHGGTIEFETEVGKGTTFTIRLPIDAEAGIAA